MSDITGLYLDKFSLLPAGQRIFIQPCSKSTAGATCPQTIFARIPK